MVFESPHLPHPPITEVVCGIAFRPISDLDPLGLGIYWNERALDYPSKSLQLAFAEPSATGFDLLPVRAVFVSKDEQFLLQLQNDRFYVSWRKRGAGYPRFSGNEGVLARTEVEFERFRRFVQSRFVKQIDVIRIDLSKIDFLRRDAHWHDLHDLAKLIPLAGAFDTIQQARSREFNLTFVERGPLGDLTVNLATVVGAGDPTGVRIDSRIQSQATNDSLWNAFRDANNTLNNAFFRMISSDELGRFEKETAK